MMPIFVLKILSQAVDGVLANAPLSECVRYIVEGAFSKNVCSEQVVSHFLFPFFDHTGRVKQPKQDNLDFHFMCCIHGVFDSKAIQDELKINKGFGPANIRDLSEEQRTAIAAKTHVSAFETLPGHVLDTIVNCVAGSAMETCTNFSQVCRILGQLALVNRTLRSSCARVISVSNITPAFFQTPAKGFTSDSTVSAVPFFCSEPSPVTPTLRFKWTPKTVRIPPDTTHRTSCWRSLIAAVDVKAPINPGEDDTAVPVSGARVVDIVDGKVVSIMAISDDGKIRRLFYGPTPAAGPTRFKIETLDIRFRCLTKLCIHNPRVMNDFFSMLSIVYKRPTGPGSRWKRTSPLFDSLNEFLMLNISLLNKNYEAVRWFQSCHPSIQKLFGSDLLNNDNPRTSKVRDFRFDVERRETGDGPGLFDHGFSRQALSFTANRGSFRELPPPGECVNLRVLGLTITASFELPNVDFTLLKNLEDVSLACTSGGQPFFTMMTIAEKLPVSLKTLSLENQESYNHGGTRWDSTSTLAMQRVARRHPHLRWLRIIGLWKRWNADVINQCLGLFCLHGIEARLVSRSDKAYGRNQYCEAMGPDIFSCIVKAVGCWLVRIHVRSINPAVRFGPLAGCKCIVIHDNWHSRNLNLSRFIEHENTESKRAILAGRNFTLETWLGLVKKVRAARLLKRGADGEPARLVKRAKLAAF